MPTLAEQTLAGIVTDNHQAAAVFEKYNLDFCCKGKRTLKEVCDERSINTDEILSELNAASCAVNSRQMPFTEMTAEQLVNHILVKHHFYVKQALPRIQNHIQKVASKHGELFPYMEEVSELFYKVNEDMTDHMRKEELVLFPRIRQIEHALSRNGSAGITDLFISGPIQVMEMEHDRAGDLMYRIRALTANYAAPEKACTTFRVCLAELKEFEEDLHEHVHLENNILFPKALQQLDMISRM